MYRTKKQTEYVWGVLLWPALLVGQAVGQTAFTTEMKGKIDAAAHGDLDRGAVLGQGEIELGGRLGAAEVVVVVAEGFGAEAAGCAAVAVGEEVAALKWFRLGHVAGTPPPGLLVSG